MSDNFERFVVPSTNLQKDAQIEQIRISEDTNKISLWFLGLSTAAFGVLIVKQEHLTQTSWIGLDNSYYAFPAIGLALMLSVIAGAIHQHLSIEERVCYRVQAILFGAQSVIPFYKNPSYPTDEVPENMHVRISRGELLDNEKISTLETKRSKGIKFRFINGNLLITQQILSTLGYAGLFALAIPYP
jgi:hypothetical protein